VLNIGMIGAGRVAEVHLPALHASPVLRLVGVHDSDAARMAARASEWDVTAYPEMQSMLESPEIDAVLVLTHVDSHLAIARAAVAEGKHVFVEKPVGREPDEILELERLASERGVVVMPGHNYAYLPEFARMKRLVEAGDLGRVRAIFVNYVIRHPEEVAKDYSGVIEEVMIHHLYLTLALLGAPLRVIAGTPTTGWERHEAEDQGWMTLDYGSATAHSFCTFAVEDMSNSPWTFLVKVLGTEGSAVVDFRSAIFARALGTLPYALVPYEESYGNELAAFAAAIEWDVPLLSTLGDAAAAAGLVEAAYLSRTTGAFVSREHAGRRLW